MSEVSFREEVTGSFTGSFLGDGGVVSHIGTASWADNARSSSFMGSGSIVSGGIVVATVGPKVLAFNADLGSVSQLSNILEAITELGGGTNRTKLDLDDFNEGRIIASIASVTNPGNDPVELAPQFSLNEVTWDFFSTGTFGGDKPSVIITGSDATVAGGFVPLKSESRADVFVRLVTFSGSDVGQKPTIQLGMVTLFFR